MNDRPPNTRVPSQRGSHRDRSIALGITGVCLLLLVSAWLISRNSPAAVQQESVALAVGDVSGEHGCDNFGTFWTTGSGVNVPVEAIEGLSNCRLADDGTWFVPTGPDDPRLVSRSVPTADQISATSVTAARLQDDLAALEDQLPDSLKESLSANYDEVNQPVFGHTKRGRTDLTVKRNRYARITQAFLIDPNREVVADYVGWVIERRVASAGAFVAACRADPDLGFVLRGCAGVPNEFTVTQIPLLWDLQDPVLINEYLIAQVARPTNEPVETPDSSK